MNDATNSGAADGDVELAPGVAASDEGADAQVTDQHDDDVDLDADPDDPDNPDAEAIAEDDEEVEYEGKKFKGPKGIKDALLRQADYTKKTQDLAEDKRAFHQAREQEVRSIQERQASVERLHEAHKVIVAERVQVGVVEAQIAGYDQLIRQARDRARSVADPNERQLLMLEAEDLADQKATLAQELSTLKSSVETKETEFASERDKAAQQSQAAAIEKGILDLQNDSRVQLNPDKFKTLSKFGSEAYGYTVDELHGALSDPRMIRTLHDAARTHVLEDQVAKLTKENAALKKGRTATDAQPAKTAGGAASPNARRPNDASGDKLSSDEWQKRRLAQKAARAEADRKSRYGS